jgi:hypothetical protein
MERYWKDRQTVLTPEPAATTELPETNNDSILSDFDRHHLALLASQDSDSDSGWQPELWRYLKDLPANVTKDTNIVEWWQVCSFTMSYKSDINTIYRSMDTLIPLFNILPLITSLVGHHPSHASGFSLQVVKLQQSAMIN